MPLKFKVATEEDKDHEGNVLEVVMPDAMPAATPPVLLKPVAIMSNETERFNRY